MKAKFQRIYRWAITVITLTVLSLTFFIAPMTWASNGFQFAISPMYEKIILNPGDTFTDSFDVVNPHSSGSAIDYEVNTSCYFVDEAYNNVYGEDSSWCKVKDWITITTGEEGTLSIGEKSTVVYTINVPKDAAGGGQYAAIMVTADVVKEDTGLAEEQEDENLSTGIKEKRAIAYLLYVEVTGDIIRQGEVVDISVPSFLLSGDIKGVSSIKNAGNTHGVAAYKLQVFPLFSDEEIYTNEEAPQTYTILPERTLYNETTWDNTPAIGIFNVIYTVEFEGVTAQVSKMVIKCPVWLLFIIVFAIAAIIIYFVVKAKARKSPRKVETE